MYPSYSSAVFKVFRAMLEAFERTGRFCSFKLSKANIFYLKKIYTIYLFGIQNNHHSLQPWSIPVWIPVLWNKQTDDESEPGPGLEPIIKIISLAAQDLSTN